MPCIYLTVPLVLYYLINKSIFLPSKKKLKKKSTATSFQIVHCLGVLESRLKNKKKQLKTERRLNRKQRSEM